MTDGREDSEDILRFLASNVESIHDKGRRDREPVRRNRDSDWAC